MILCIAGLILVLNESKSKPGTIGQREPLPGFGYCSLKQVKPCVLSFHLDSSGGMVINILTNSLQDFYIKVRYEEGERTYACTRARKYSANVSCKGEALP